VCIPYIYIYKLTITGAVYISNSCRNVYVFTISILYIYKVYYIGTYLCICVRFILKPYRSGVCTARRWHRVPNQNAGIYHYTVYLVCVCVHRLTSAFRTYIYLFCTSRNAKTAMPGNVSSFRNASCDIYHIIIYTAGWEGRCVYKPKW